MMTNEEIARANADWAALPGTPPDAYSFRSHSKIGDCLLHDVVKEMRALHPECSWFRVTRTELGIWLECWKDRPQKQAAFNPPMVHS